MRAFRGDAPRLPFADWPRRFWALLLAAPLLRRPAQRRPGRRRSRCWRRSAAGRARRCCCGWSPACPKPTPPRCSGVARADLPAGAAAGAAAPRRRHAGRRGWHALGDAAQAAHQAPAGGAPGARWRRPREAALQWPQAATGSRWRTRRAPRGRAGWRPALWGAVCADRAGGRAPLFLLPAWLARRRATARRGSASSRCRPPKRRLDVSPPMRGCRPTATSTCWPDDDAAAPRARSGLLRLVCRAADAARPRRPVRSRTVPAERRRRRRTPRPPCRR